MRSLGSRPAALGAVRTVPGWITNCGTGVDHWSLKVSFGLPRAKAPADPAAADLGCAGPDEAMTRGSRVLVTGATGRLGSAVCRALLDHRHDVRATDVRFAAGFPVSLELGDLRDELFAYRVMDGCRTVVHCGNHPNPFAGPPAPRLLAENGAMNGNVFWAVQDLGVESIIFASSIQVMLKFDGFRRDQPYVFPYFPLDGDAPADPGVNAYALSKHLAEQMLRVLCAERPELAATVLRFPMLAPDRWLRWMRSDRALSEDALSLGEALSYLQFPDAADLVRRVVEQRRPGYRQYFPATSVEITNLPVPELVRRHYAHVPLRQPIDEMTSLVDATALRRDFGWEPQRVVSVEVEL